MTPKSKHVGAGRAGRAGAWKSHDGTYSLDLKKKVTPLNGWYYDKQCECGYVRVEIRELPQSRKGRNSNRNRLDKSRR